MRLVLALFSLIFGSSLAISQLSIEVGNVTPTVTVPVQSMDLMEGLSARNDLSTYVTGLSAAGLSSLMKSPGPYTVFAPNNEAFSKLPIGSFDAWMQPTARGDLAKIMSYHIVPGRYDGATLSAAIDQSSNGTVQLTSVAGNILTLRRDLGDFMIRDDNGNEVPVELSTAYQRNGVIHVVNTVLLPH